MTIWELDDTIKNESWSFAPDGMDFYSFKIIRLSPIPQMTLAKYLSWFLFVYSNNMYNLKL